jgi:hypothetical protein
VKKYNDEKLIKAYFDFIVVEGIPGNLMWDNGILSYLNEYEALLYHLISFKRVNKEQNVEYESIPNIYHIDRDKIRWSLLRILLKQSIFFIFLSVTF